MKHIKIVIGSDENENDKVEQAREILAKAEEIKKDKSLMAKLSEKKPKIKSIDDLRKLQEKPNYGINEDKDEDGDSAEDVDHDPAQDGENTNDDDAQMEEKQKRVKNSSSPTVVGKRMK